MRRDSIATQNQPKLRSVFSLISGMKVPTVNKFLFHFDLTTGGLVLGYLGAAVNAGLAFCFFYDLFHDVRRFKLEVMELGLTENEVEVAEDLFNEEERQNVSETFLTQAMFVTLAILIFTILIGCFIISLWFVQGVKDRDARKVKYFMIIMALGILISFLRGILTLSSVWILIAMANVYFLIVVYSLYEVLMSEDGEQVKSHLTAGTKGYEKCYESREEYCGEGIESGGGGYQTSEFNEP